MSGEGEILDIWIWWNSHFDRDGFPAGDAGRISKKNMVRVANVLVMILELLGVHISTS